MLMGYQQKQKRDRIGFIFKKAKAEGWDRAQKIYEESSWNTLPRRPAKELVEKQEIQNLEMRLKEDGNFAKSGKEPKITNEFPDGTFELLMGKEGVRVFREHDQQFENKIDVDERDLVNYDLMFSSLPQHESDSQQEFQN